MLKIEFRGSGCLLKKLKYRKTKILEVISVSKKKKNS